MFYAVRDSVVIAQCLILSTQSSSRPQGPSAEAAAAERLSLEVLFPEAVAQKSIGAPEVSDSDVSSPADETKKREFRFG